MNAIFEKDMSGIEHLMSNETICWGEVARLARDTDGQSYMVTTLPMMQQRKVSGGERCVIYASEADADNVNPHLMNLMGRQVPFIVTAVDEENNRLLCSRKKAQTTLKAAMLYYGGIAAEELIFGRSEVTTGASQDIKEASFWIREYLRYESVHGLLDEESFTGRPYSESSLEEAQKLSKELYDPKSRLPVRSTKCGFC